MTGKYLLEANGSRLPGTGLHRRTCAHARDACKDLKSAGAVDIQEN